MPASWWRHRRSIGTRFDLLRFVTVEQEDAGGDGEEGLGGHLSKKCFEGWTALYRSRDEVEAEHSTQKSERLVHLALGHVSEQHGAFHAPSRAQIQCSKDFPPFFCDAVPVAQLVNLLVNLLV